jgi:hypothetical protein
MADRFPSSAPLFVNESEFDEIAGYPSREEDTDRLIHAPGSNQNLWHQANHHGEGPAGATSRVWTSQSNRVQRGALPKAAGPVIGENTHANPAGGPEQSLEE